MRQLLLDEVRRSVRTAFPDVGDDVVGTLTLDPPRDPSHGDFASNVAFRLKDLVRDNPRRIAETIVASLREDESIGEAEVAGPGFINFRIRPDAIRDFLKRLASAEERAAMMQDPVHVAAIGRLQIEFVSANPTGPMNVVSARAAAYGDACIRLSRAIGVDASAEFYVNDEGNQARIFGESLKTRFLQQAGRSVELAEDAYRGEYVTELARELFRTVATRAGAGASAADLAGAVAAAAAEGKTIRQLAQEAGVSGGSDASGASGASDASGSQAVDPAIVDAVVERLDFAGLGIQSMVASAKESLARFGVEFDCWFRESALHRAGDSGESRVEEAERLLRERGHVKEEGGALWFTSTEFGDDKDRVVRRAGGDPTYLLGDLAYHLDKARRGFDRVIDVWGPDHHGYVKRLHSATVALGQSEDWLAITIVQQVNLLRDGEPVKMSKRGGELVTLDELVEEVGKDVSRFFFLMRRSSTHLDFDLELAKKESLENPVYYVQYAHARSRSIFRQPMAERVLAEASGEPDLARLTSDDEITMMRTLLRYPEIVQESARALEPHRLVAYLREVASDYHRFYTSGKQDAGLRVLVDDDPGLSRARLWLVGLLADVLREGLSLLGIDALEQM